jgi:hypothetical protein
MLMVPFIYNYDFHDAFVGLGNSIIHNILFLWENVLQLV